MPFLAKEHWPVPEKDLMSWYFDDPQYDLDQPVYIDAENPSRAYTGRQARETIRKLVAGIRALGLKENDCVCLHSFNDIDYSILVNGIVASGAIFAGTNPAYQFGELVHHIKTAKVKALIVEPDLLDQAVKAADSCGIPRSRVLAFDGPGRAPAPSGFKSWRTLLDHGEQDWVRFSGEQAKNKTAARLFSSGTTGLPKAAFLTHYNMIAQHTLVEETQMKDYKVRRLMALPFFHVAAVPGTHFSCLRDGTKVYVMKRFNLERFMANLERHQITDLACVPPIVIAIIMSPLRKKYSLKSIRLAHCGAAPLDKAPQARMRELLPSDTPFTQVWGMTETSCICTHFTFREDDKTGSVGYMLPDIDAKLVDEQGNDISDYDVRGEICVRGPTVIGGYFENPEATARDWDKDGYFHTGDIGYCARGTGKWYIVDRKKELIKVRTFQVAPPELEGWLVSHPSIVDAAVIGVIPNKDDGGELPRAYVVRRPDDEQAAKLTEKDVQEYMKKNVAKYKWLEGGVKFVDALPRNASGKLLKRLLRESAEREMKTEGLSKL